MRYLKTLLAVFLAGIAIGFFLRSPDTFLQQVTNAPSPAPTTMTASPSAGIKMVVKRVIDGDTIELENGQTVRYIGMNTPEIQHANQRLMCFGNEAKEDNKKLVEGKEILLEKDVSEVDKYKRLLRYVFLPGATATDTPLFINEYLVRQGFAQVATYPPDVKYEKLFQEAEKEARDNSRGLWKMCR